MSTLLKVTPKCTSFSQGIPFILCHSENKGSVNHP